jgi:two-component system NtrC family sensor kinase
VKDKFKATIRIKLIISLFSVVIIAGAGSVAISIKIINENILGQAYDEVQTNLTTAEYVYNNKINVINLFIKHLASLSYLQEAIAKNDHQLLINKLLEVKNELGLDILNITDSKGRIIIRANNDRFSGDDVSGDTFVKYVINSQTSCYGTSVIPKEHLIRESAALFSQAYIKVKPTAMSRKRDKEIEDRGMVIMAASPVFYNGRMTGIIYGARLLNNSFELVDRIKSLVFKDEKIGGVDLGTATIFLDDLRISTNVKNSDGTRAIGTRVSEEVYKKVVEQQKLWLAKAFVVNQWYISAYSPIYNIGKNVIGILYVGILEEKYNVIKRKTYFYYFVMTCITAVIALAIAIYLINDIITPIRALVSASKEILLGNYSNKLIIHSGDEIGYLCSTFNKMIDAIKERDSKLKDQTDRQIVQSEKLASLGRLASGIAHEINNPLTGVLSYSTSLLEDLGDTGYREDLQVIVNETKRCRDIVRGILDFARESQIEKEPASINQIIENSLTILAKHVTFQNVNIEKKLSENLPQIELDINQMKSVINNLVVNAADAMPDGGKLSISTFMSYSNSKEREIIIEISDTGTGISEENITRIFDPFFSTKEVGKGTGLGLSVTRRIIEKHNGKIDVSSRLGEGTTFKIHLPIIS